MKRMLSNCLNWLCRPQWTASYQDFQYLESSGLRKGCERKQIGRAYWPMSDEFKYRCHLWL